MTTTVVADDAVTLKSPRMVCVRIRRRRLLNASFCHFANKAPAERPFHAARVRRAQQEFRQTAVPTDTLIFHPVAHRCCAQQNVLKCLHSRRGAIIRHWSKRFAGGYRSVLIRSTAATVSNVGRRPPARSAQRRGISVTQGVFPDGCSAGHECRRQSVRTAIAHQ